MEHRARLTSAACAFLVACVAGCADDDAEASAAQRRQVPSHYGCTHIYANAGELRDEGESVPGVTAEVLGRPGGNGIALGADFELTLWLSKDAFWDEGKLARADALEIQGTGALDQLEWFICPNVTTTARVRVRADKIGDGDIVVRVDGAEYHRYEMFVAEPVAMEVTLDRNRPSMFQAHLLDTRGRRLYAEDILWQFAPFPFTTNTYANVAEADNLFTFGTSLDAMEQLLVVASRGSLSTTLTLTPTPSGDWQVEDR